MAVADEGEDYQIGNHAVREIHHGPVWASRKPNAKWSRLSISLKPGSHHRKGMGYRCRLGT
jgi:hypothetical protein